mmetsp:Transcript_21439/g.43550  ORF Transcript_21439/g.43550 Transcript_21439/m.43550 type:complete len:752 (-) Transcript_21439:216-2471(-)
MRMNTDLEQNAPADFGDDQSTLQPPPSDGDFMDVPTHDEEAPNVQDHSQLPSPEQYKANMNGGAVIGTGANIDIDNPQDGDDVVHDQLPSVQEYKTSMSFNNKDGSDPKDFKKSRAGLYTFLGLFLLTVIVTAIAVPTAMKKQGQGRQSSKSSAASSSNGGASSGSTPTNYVITATPPPHFTPTPPPQMAPLANRFDETFKYLTNYGVVDREVLADITSAQYKATKWIADEDDYNIAVPVHPAGTKYTDTRFVERWTLAIFYFSTGGPSWKYQNNFLAPVDHCFWFSTLSDPLGRIFKMGVTNCVNDYDGQRVTEIEMSNNNLSGPLPSELQYLVRLVSWITPFNLELGGDTGMVPFLPLVETLAHLELQYCGLAGTIPEKIGNLEKLVFLGLGNNVLTGEIPESFFGLTNLEVLGLDDNQLESSIAPFAKLTKIQKLYLEDNLITGEITDEMLTIGWADMVDLDLSVNRIEGPIPEKIWTMPNLQVVDIHGNDFIGQIPKVDSVNEKLVFLALQDNSLEWRIPESISNLASLRHFDISANKFVSPIPSTMSQMTNLVSLYTGLNGFDENPIPDFLANMTNLLELSMKQNKLTGEIPSFFGSFTNLQVLDLDFNRLNGTIPSELGLLSGLDTLMLNRNYLSGTIPSSFSNLVDLDVLVLDGNNITGSADPICGQTAFNLTFFSSDCDRPDAEVECSCCNICCNDNNATCNNFDWTVNLDGIWEYDFQRLVYTFSQEALPVDAKKKLYKREA